MTRSAVFAPLLLLAGALTLSAASRIISVEPAMASPGSEVVVAGTELDVVEKFFLTVGSTDIEVETVQKSADEARLRLPADIAHGQYRLMIQTGGDAPALLVQPVMCEVMSQAEADERLAEQERELRRLEDPAPEPPPAQ